MTLDWIDDYKNNLENPLNLKGFRLLLNKESFKSNITEEKLQQIESEILEIPYKTNPERDIKKLLDEIEMPARSIEPKKFNNVVLGGKKFSIQPGEVRSSNISPKKNSQFEFIYDEEPVSDITKDVVNTLDYELELLKKEEVRLRIRDSIKELKVLNPDGDEMDTIIKLSKSTNLSTEQLEHIRIMLDREVSNYEGRVFVKDSIVSALGLIETYFDGSTNVMGRYPDLTGLGDKMEVNLRKRKTETAHIYQSVKETIGLSPTTQIGLDIFINGLGVLKRNSDSSTSTQSAIRMTRDIK